MDNNGFRFDCDRKCRICPYPGSLCKSQNPLYRKKISHARTDEVSYISRELQDQILKAHGIL